jgi:hypothetical protein
MTSNPELDDFRAMLREMFEGGVGRNLPPDTEADRKRRAALLHETGLDVPVTQGVHISKPRRKNSNSK